MARRKIENSFKFLLIEEKNHRSKAKVTHDLRKPEGSKVNHTFKLTLKRFNTSGPSVRY